MADIPTDPWSGATEQPTTPADPWSTPAPPPDGSTSWLGGSGDEQATGFDWSNPFDQAVIPLDDWVEKALDWLVTNLRPFFKAISLPVDTTLRAIETSLQSSSVYLIILIITLIAWQAAGRRQAIITLFSLIFIGLIGAWSEAMVTLSLVLTSVLFCFIIGLPTGIWMSRSDKGARILRPVLDAMQTTPAFVYLVPIVMLFGIGNVPGVVVTIIFALPPLIRLTNLGIRQVPEDLIEAARSFGASPRQLLFKVQLPLAMPTILAGINQTLMLALSMVVIASMIAVGGLGQMVLRGIGRLDMGTAGIGGAGIVLLAIILDRITQAMGRENRSKDIRHWHETGPVGLINKCIKRCMRPKK